MDLITRTILGYTAEVVGVNPDHAETISPFRVNWVLLGHILNAKKA